jgi:hypothetical protein
MLISHQPRANRQGMGIAVRGLCRCFAHARARGDTKDWEEPPLFWFVRTWETIKHTTSHSFSLVYLWDRSPIRSLVGINR